MICCRYDLISWGPFVPCWGYVLAVQFLHAAGAKSESWSQSVEARMVRVIIVSYPSYASPPHLLASSLVANPDQPPCLSTRFCLPIGSFYDSWKARHKRLICAEDLVDHYLKYAQSVPLCSEGGVGVAKYWVQHIFVLYLRCKAS